MSTSTQKQHKKKEQITETLVSSAFLFSLCRTPLQDVKYFTEREHQFGYLQDIINDVQLTMSACVWSAGGGGGGGEKKQYSSTQPAQTCLLTLHPERKEEKLWHDGRLKSSSCRSPDGL